MTRSVFISYRREDSKAWAGRIYDRLVEFYGRKRVFIDVGDIQPGQDFRTAILEVLSTCSICLVLIGPKWLEVKDGKGQRRLDDPKDLVRIEVENALRAGVQVIPLLIDGATMPTPADLPAPLRPLTRRNAFRITHDHFDADVNTLTKDLPPTWQQAYPFSSGRHDRI